ncbi:MAG TPA: hypothetical protein ENJ95_18240 [Bacteroidetes bacterium]|nr:hypothetical protein [Bacteroidota bacterium]
MQHFLILFFCCFISINIFGQTLTITNGETEKTFKPSSVYVISFGEGEPSGKCCDWTEMTGTLSGLNKDSIRLRLSKYTQMTVAEDLSSDHTITYKNDLNFGSLAKKDIYSLVKYKSLKSKKRKNNFGIAGGILLFTGVTTALNSFIVSDKDSKRDILLSGAAQVGLSITFLAFNSTPKYKFRGDGNIWRIK